MLTVLGQAKYLTVRWLWHKTLFLPLELLLQGSDVATCAETASSGGACYPLFAWPPSTYYKLSELSCTLEVLCD